LDKVVDGAWLKAEWVIYASVVMDAFVISIFLQANVIHVVIPMERSDKQL